MISVWPSVVMRVAQASSKLLRMPMHSLNLREFKLIVAICLMVGTESTAGALDIIMMYMTVCLELEGMCPSMGCIVMHGFWPMEATDAYWLAVELRLVTRCTAEEPVLLMVNGDSSVGDSVAMSACDNEAITMFESVTLLV